MIAIAKRNVIIRTKDGEFFLRREEFTDVPAHIAESPFFKALCADGVIVATNGTSDATVTKAMDIADAAEKEAIKRTRKKK